MGNEASQAREVEHAGGSRSLVNKSGRRVTRLPPKRATTPVTPMGISAFCECAHAAVARAPVGHAPVGHAQLCMHCPHGCA
jgi:hypothetical protein